jgi:hypothetical protein
MRDNKPIPRDSQNAICRHVETHSYRRLSSINKLCEGTRSEEHGYEGRACPEQKRPLHGRRKEGTQPQDVAKRKGSADHDRTVVLYDERVIALEMGPSHWYALYHKVIPDASACDCNSFTIERWLLG